MTEPALAQTPPATPPASPLRTCVGLLVPVLIVLFLIAVLLGAAGGTLRWMLVKESGSSWLLSRLPFVQVKGFSGALLGDHWHAERLRIEWSGGRQWMLFEDLQADGLDWRWRPGEHAWIGLKVDKLAVRKLTLQTGPPSGRPIVLPLEIAPPLQVAVAQARVGEFQLNLLDPWRNAAIDDFTLDPTPGGDLRAERLAFEAGGLAVSGVARIGHAAPLPLSVQATVRPLLDGDAPRWAAVLAATGSLEKMTLTGTLRGRPVPAVAGRGAAAAQEAPAVDLRANLQPLQSWLLAGLSLQTTNLDLAALWGQAPATRLSGHAELSGGDNGTPLAVMAEIDNTLPGRLDEGRLPLAKLSLDARGELARPDRLELKKFELAMADAMRPAGRLTGSALWQGHELKIETRLAAVAPQRLDSRAPSMTLAGPLAVTLRGLPSPDFKAAQPSTPPGLEMRWKLDLEGKLETAPAPVRLEVEGEFDDAHLALTVAKVKAGAASADLRAALTRANHGAWTLETVGKVLDFDPAIWLPGAGGSADAAEKNITAWRRGPHRLSGEWQLDARLPADAQRLKPLDLAQRVAGNGRLNIHDSVLAGVPLSAEIVLGYAQNKLTAPTTEKAPMTASSAAAAERTAAAAGTLHADIRLGANQLLLDGRGDPLGKGAGDRWRAELKAETLATWAPLTRLLPVLNEWVPRQGSANAVISAQGRWPALQTEGTAQVSQLQLGTLSLARASAGWTLDMRGEARADLPLSLQFELAGAQMGVQRADNLRAEIKGTLADHHIEISGALPLTPPPIAEQMLGIQVQSGTRVQMQAQGAWRPDTAGGSGAGGRWQARIAQLLVGSWDGSPDSGPPASGWAEARDLKAELRFDGRGDLLSIQAEPGRVKLADAAVLRWDTVRVDFKNEASGAPLQIQLHADIDPFLLAPLLARAQPDMGWQGDLRLAARLDIRAGERVDADLIFERASGDLHAASGDGVQLLGLTEFKLSLAAHDGIWNFTQSFRGRSLGEIAGQMRVQTTPEARWPKADAPISGNLQLRVADIGIWSGWVPPGWHLGGEVRANAELGGTFGGPQYTGALSGSGLGVRNLLEGVNVSDGQIAVKLSGTTAEIERFTLKGGEGLLSLTGGATFGSAPQARLQIQADHFRVLGRVDRQLIASGKAALTLQPDQTRLEGQFKIDEGLFDLSRSDTPKLDEDVAVRRVSRSDEAPTQAAPPKARRGLTLALTVDVGDKVRLRWRGLDTLLRGQVRMSAPDGRLAVNGTISTDSGTFVSYGQKLEIERGIIAFNGNVATPRLDVLALRPNIDNRVGVLITGTLPSLRIKLFSEPELSDADKLSWLVLGRAPDGLGRNDTALLQRAAMALLSGEGEAPTDALLKNLGIDELSLRQGDTDVRETVVTLGKQLSRNWYLGYERGVNATTGTWQLIYRIAQRFTLRAQSGLDSSVDVIWTLRVHETPVDAPTRKVTVAPR